MLSSLITVDKNHAIQVKVQQLLNIHINFIIKNRNKGIYFLFN